VQIGAEARAVGPVGQWVVAADGGEWEILAILGPAAPWATWVGAGVGVEWVGPEGARQIR